MMNRSQEVLEGLGHVDEEEDVAGLGQVIKAIDDCEKKIEAVFNASKISEFAMGSIREDLSRMKLHMQHRIDRIKTEKPVGDGPLFGRPF